MPLRLGTRGSALALAQSGHVADALRALGREVELVPIRSEGDDLTGPLAALGTTGVFATRLRQSLAAGDCDLLVHSFKDLPVDPYPGLAIAAVPARRDAGDALCGATLATLRRGARVGTGSPRRAAALLRLRPDLEIVPIRGNVDTRLGKVGDGLDAVVLAVAGLERLDRIGEVSEFLPVDDVLPAPAQGALAVETVAGSAAEAIVAVLDDAATRAAVTAERAVLAELQAGCSAPIGAHAMVTGGGDLVSLTARVIAPDGRSSATAQGAGTDPEAVGRAAGAELRELMRADPALAGLLT